MGTNPTVKIFAIINMLLAGLGLLGLCALSLGWIYGIFFSGDPARVKILGSLSILVYSIPIGFGFALFLSAGIGLWKEKTWGYYLHIAAAVLAAFSLIGIVYMIFALIFAFQPEFKAVFFGAPAEKGQPPTPPA